MSIQRDYKVRGNEIDPSYLLRPYHLISYFQDCFAIYCTSKGVATFQDMMQGKTWIVKELMVEFLDRMPGWDQYVSVKVMVRSIKGVKIEVDFECFNENRTLARGTSRWIIIRKESRRPIRADFLNQMLETKQNCPFEGYEFTKLNAGNSYSWKFTDVVKSFEIDFNYHLHGIKYIERALESIPLVNRSAKNLRKLEISFLRELSMNNKLQSLSVMSSDKGIHELRNEEGSKCVFLMHSQWQ